MGRVVWGSLGQFGVVCIEEEYKIYKQNIYIYIYIYINLYIYIYNFYLLQVSGGTNHTIYTTSG